MLATKRQIKCRGGGKGHPTTDHEGPEGEQKYSSTLSLTSAIDGVGGQRHAPIALPTGKRPFTHCIGRGEFRPRQTRQLPRAVDLKGRLLSC